jgi:HEAT repeat protein
MKLKKILWLVLGLGAVVFVAARLGFGPYRPRFPIKARVSREPYSVLTREQSNFMAEVRAIGLRRDRSQIAKVLKALKEEHPLIVITAILALARLETPEAIKDLVALQSQLPENSELQPFIALALARIEAGHAFPEVKDERQLQAKMRHFLKVAKVSPSQIHKGALWYTEQCRKRLYSRWAPFEVQVLRQAAEMAGEAYQNGILNAFKVTGLDFSLDYASQLKAKLGQMSREHRIQWLVDSLSKKQVGRWEEDYEIQALADEGLVASKAIIAKLQEMRTHRTQYRYHAGFALLFRTLACIGDHDSIPVVKSFLNDSDSWVRYYAKQALRYLEQRWCIVRATDY